MDTKPSNTARSHIERVSEKLYVPHTTVGLVCGFCPSDQTFAAGFLQILRQAKRQVDYHLTMDTLAFGYMLPVIRAH